MSDAPRRGSLLVVFLTVFIDLLGFGIVIPLLPIYGQDLANQYGWTKQQVGWVIGPLMASFSAMQFLFAPLWGRLSDRIGRRPVLLIGLAGSVASYALFGVATVQKSLWMLFVSRIGAGLSGATISTAQAYIADSTTLEKRARGMALVGAAFGLGFTFGPLFAYLAVPSGQGDPGPGPGYAAAALSAVALVLAWLRLPESLRPDSASAARQWFDLASLREALAVPSLGALLVTLFVSVFAFANLEVTLSILIKDSEGAFRFSYQQVCLTFAFIGLTLALAQGVLVRRLATRVSEATLAGWGAALESVGFVWQVWAIEQQSVGQMFGALTVLVMGFALLVPSLNSLISRRSDPARQGGILGVSQSASALARILGPVFAVRVLATDARLPYLCGAILMAASWALITWRVRRGQDYAPPSRDRAKN